MMDLLTGVPAINRYPSAPGLKGGGASAAAAIQIAPKAATIREQVHAWFREHRSGTPERVAKALNRSLHSVRSRMSELVADGTLIKTDRTVESAAGATQHIYELR